MWTDFDCDLVSGDREAIMPKRARGRRKSKTRGGGGLSEASKQKLDAIAEEARGETLEDLVADFDIQSTNELLNTD